MSEYRIVDSDYGPTVNWYNCDQAGAALDEFMGYRQILIYDEDEETEQPTVIVRFNKENKVVEVQTFKYEILVLSKDDKSPWQSERDLE